MMKQFLTWLLLFVLGSLSVQEAAAATKIAKKTLRGAAPATDAAHPVASQSTAETSRKVDKLISAFRVLVGRLNDDQEEDSRSMHTAQDQCVHQQLRLTEAANYLEKDCAGLKKRSNQLHAQIKGMTKLQKKFTSEPETESVGETEIQSMQGLLTKAMLDKRLQDLLFKAQQTFERHTIKLQGLKSIRVSAQTLAKECLQGLSAHETRTLSRREVGSTVAYAERQIRVAMKRSQNQAAFDMRKAAETAVQIGKSTVNEENVNKLTNKILSMATTMVYSDATEEARKEISGVASTLSLDNLHDHANVRRSFDKLATLREDVENSAKVFETAAINATKQRERLESSSTKVRHLENLHHSEMEAADVSRTAAVQQDLEAVQQEFIVNATEILLKSASHLVSKANVGALLRAKADSLLLHELPVARSALAAAQHELRLVKAQRRPSRFVQLKEATAKVQRLRASLGRAEDDGAFVHWLSKGNSRSQHPSPASIRDEITEAEGVVNKLSSVPPQNGSELAVDVGESAADSELEMSYRLCLGKLKSTKDIVNHVESTVRDLLRHAREVEQELIEGLWGPNTSMEGAEPPNDPLFHEFVGVFLDDLDDEYDESTNSSHVKDGEIGRRMEWNNLLLSLRDRKSRAVSANLRALFEAEEARKHAHQHDATAVKSLVKAKMERVLRDRIASKDLPATLNARARKRAALETATQRRDSALELMQATTDAEKESGDASGRSANSTNTPAHRPLSFESRLADVVHQIILKSGAMDAKTVDVLLRKASVELSVSSAVNQVGTGTALSTDVPGLRVQDIVRGIPENDGSADRRWSQKLENDEQQVRKKLYHTLRILQKGNVMILKATKICTEVDAIHRDVVAPNIKKVAQRLSQEEIPRERAIKLSLDAVRRADEQVIKAKKKLKRGRVAQSNPLFFTGKEAELGTKIPQLEHALEDAKETAITTRIALDETLRTHIEEAKSSTLATSETYNTTALKDAEYRARMAECKRLVALLPPDGKGLPPSIRKEAKEHQRALRAAYKTWVRDLLSREKDTLLDDTRTTLSREVTSYNNQVLPSTTKAGTEQRTGIALVRKANEARGLPAQMVDSIADSVHAAATTVAVDINNTVNMETTLNLTGYALRSMSAPKSTTFDMDSEIALLHDEDNEKATVLPEMHDMLKSPASVSAIWNQYEHGDTPKHMVKSALDSITMAARRKALYNADVTARAGLAKELMSRLHHVNYESAALNNITQLWQQLSSSEKQLKKLWVAERTFMEKVTLKETQEQKDRLIRIEQEIVDKSQEDSGVVRTTGLLVEFDDVATYVNEGVNDEVFILREIRNLVASALGGLQVVPSWLSSSSSLDAENSVLSTSLRVDLPTLPAAKRVAQALKTMVSIGLPLSKVVRLPSTGKLTTMRLKWLDGEAHLFEIGTATSTAPLPKRYVPPPIVEEDIPMDESSNSTNSTMSVINTTGIQEAPNDDWYMDLDNNNDVSPSKNLIMLVTAWDGPQAATTYFDQIVAPVASAERTANQAKAEQKHAQQRLVASEMELQTLELREEAIEQLLRLVDQLASDGESQKIIGTEILKVTAVLEHHHQHGPKSVENAMKMLQEAVEKTSREVNQTTSDSILAEVALEKVQNKRKETNPMEAPVIIEGITARQENKRREKGLEEEMLNILAQDKLYQEITECIDRLESTKMIDDLFVPVEVNDVHV